MNARPPPPQGAPPPYAFVSRVYRRNLRPVVIMVAFLGGLWSLFSGIGYFRSYGVDRSQNVPRIANLSVALGALYMAVFLIEAFGIVAAYMQRVSLVRTYALLSAFTALIVTGTDLARVVTHFTWKNDIINECTTLSTDGTIVWFGFWGPVSERVLTPQEANAWCRDSWDHDSWALIVAFLILSLLSIFFSAVAFSYWRQLLDPASPANSARAPPSQVRMDGFPTHYNPPYSNNYAGDQSFAPNLPYQPYAAERGYGFSERDDPFAPPYNADSKPPGYTGAGTDGDFKGEYKSGDPFSDSDGSNSRDDRDATSRPGPGGAFR